MTRTAIVLFLALAAAVPMQGSWRRRLPTTERVVETTAVSSSHGARLLVLWMEAAREHRGTLEPDEPLSCPELASGRHFLRGLGRVSLIDVRREMVINTIRLDTNSGSPTLDVPLELARTLYDRRGGGAARIMSLRDLNDDGRANEFVIFATESCSDRYGTAVGYSERRDRVISYTFELRVVANGAVTKVEDQWIPAGFFDAPQTNGAWRFQWHYPEEPPQEYRYEIRYDSQRERFVGAERVVRDQ